MIPINPHIPKQDGVYIVGGCIRDLLLARPPVDYDIAVLENPEEFARRVAASVGGRLVHFGRAGQQTIRIVSTDAVFDVSAVKGTSIEADLQRRDFTINALAYDLASNKIIDPVKGREDLAGKRVRMVSENAFRQDPLRLLRAYRLAAVLGFSIAPQTAGAIKAHAANIQKSAGERIRFELIRLLAAADSSAYLNEMAATGLLAALLPELARLEECVAGRPEGENPFLHTLAAYRGQELLLNDLDALLPDCWALLRRRLEHKYVVLLKWAMLLHDLGQAAVRKPLPDGEARAGGHAARSAETAEAICRRFKFSNKERAFVEFIIRNQLRPRSLYCLWLQKKPGRFTRFFMRCGSLTPFLLLHSWADVTAGGHPGAPESYAHFIGETLCAYFSRYQPMQAASPLITGDDLISALGLTPSPRFKRILARVEEARINGHVRTRDAALKLAAEILCLDNT